MSGTLTTGGGALYKALLQYLGLERRQDAGRPRGIPLARNLLVPDQRIVFFPRVWRVSPDFLPSSGCRARAVLRRPWNTDRRVPAPQGAVAALLRGGPADLPGGPRRGDPRGDVPADLEPAAHPAGAH